MKKQIILSSLMLSMLFLLLSGCHKGGSPYYKAAISETVKYDGTVLQYLESQKGLYDSMVLIIKRYPHFKQMLSSPGSMTIFAIPNTAFQTAIKSFNLERAKQDSVPLYFSPNDMSRPDSGMVDYLGLEKLIARYIFNKRYTYEDLAESSTGFPTESVLGYQMNLKAIQQNAVGAVKDGPKVIELSDMNNSRFNRFWKSALTSTIGAVQADNALVHVLSQNHEFGFASFADKLLAPAWDRTGWTPIAWHSQYLGTWGGTVAHALDNDLSTRWHSVSGIPLPLFFTVDMKKNLLIGGVTIQVRTDGAHDGSPVDFTVQFAKEGADLKDSSVWTSFRFDYKADGSTIKLPHKFPFDNNVKVEARYFRFIVNQVFSGRLYTDRPYSNLDEIWMLY
ncbi:discoidin domain-containing protein [Niabella sp.]|uniref:discoidin domain-containing protein n=1 Tax=Niabella sp. TaxID=1962976 RepID=UPI00261C289E|nr:discoidin domain-containing protein [Niabella sp.]